jgi:double-strand break repair protein AddB
MAEPLFPPREGPRVFALPPGCDYAGEIVAGLRARLAGQPPEALARIELFVNTRRTQRRLTSLFAAEGATLLPRIRLVTDLADDPGASDLPPPVSSLRRRLDLAQAVARLIESQPDIAPRGAVFDLAGSLAELMDEMRGEGVTPADLARLDVSGHSSHWDRSLQFLQVITTHWAPGQPPDTGERQRHAVEQLAARWAAAPPGHPVIVAGSTGSRGATALFMDAVARLPQGALVLPGFDFDMPRHAWAALDEAMSGEDHPQYRFHRLMARLGLEPGDIARWAETPPAAPERNRLISLALRPAPVTDQWLEEGPALTGLDRATARMTLLEAPDPRGEALAIALMLRAAVDEGRSAALITPDRVLTRQVTAALDRWGIEPDDSAGTPLPLSPPGRFLRQVAELRGAQLTNEALLALLKHPLTASSDETRGAHGLRTLDLETRVLRDGPPFPDMGRIARWAGERRADPGAAGWAAWLAACLDGIEDDRPRALGAHLAAHLALAEALAAGPGARAGAAGALWAEDAGEEAGKVVERLRDEADAGGEMTAMEYASLFHGVLEGEEVRSAVRPHPRVMIWGTLEARVQVADLVILGGLNDGTWPKRPAPDPWLNRAMRREAGLLLPERQIGLAAHDFQQAAAAPEVVLSRALRDAEAPTVPSRWLNRLTNLLAGLGAPGLAALDDMQARGKEWAGRAAALERPRAEAAPARRPSPRPPVAARPKGLSFTQVRTLIRDPYAIYARHVLALRPLDPLTPEPDAPLRGTLIHEIMQRFVAETGPGALPPDAAARLMQIAGEVLEDRAPWPAARRIWLARLARVADWIVAGETARRDAGATPLALEHRGAAEVGDTGFRLSGVADRIDRTADGRLVIYDYKTGKPPSARVVATFDKQLPLEGAMAERGAFPAVPAAPVAGLVYIGLGTSPEQRDVFEDGLIDETWADLARLVAAYARRETGYTSRARMQRRNDAGDYDHLARLGEWDESESASPEDVG